MNKQPDCPEDPPQRLLRCILLLGRVLRAARAGTALPSAQLQTLGVLYRNRRATASELAAELGIKKQSLTVLLAALHEQGWIERKKDLADARKVLLTLTLAGREVFLRELRGRRDRLAGLMADRLSGREAAALLAVLPLLEKLAGNGEDPAGSGRSKSNG